MNYYSQLGQDKWVDEIFKGMKYGYFVDIGAANGILISNTYALEKERKWDGLCIEPHSLNFKELQKNRKCKVDNSFVMRDGEEVKYTEFLVGGNRFFSAVNPPPRDSNEIVTRTCQTVSLFSIFEQYHVPTIIHFMSMDVEGLEYEILKDYFEKEYHPSGQRFHTRYILTLAVEHNFKEPMRTNMRELLIAHNYVFVKEMFHDDFYVYKAMDILV